LIERSAANDSRLIVPVMDSSGVLRSMQFIDSPLHSILQSSKAA
jgi:hypothetical protein